MKKSFAFLFITAIAQFASAGSCHNYSGSFISEMGEPMTISQIQCGRIIVKLDELNPQEYITDGVYRNHPFDANSTLAVLFNYEGNLVFVVKEINSIIESTFVQLPPNNDFKVHFVRYDFNGNIIAFYDELWIKQ